MVEGVVRMVALMHKPVLGGLPRGETSISVEVSVISATPVVDGVEQAEMLLLVVRVPPLLLQVLLAVVELALVVVVVVQKVVASRPAEVEVLPMLKNSSAHHPARTTTRSLLVERAALRVLEQAATVPPAVSLSPYTNPPPTS